MSRRQLVGALGVAAAVVTAAGPAHGGVVDAPRLKRVVAATGLNNPRDLAFTPDGRMLVTQRTGQIGVKQGRSVAVLRRPVDVKVGGEGGLMGLAVDPGFATNRRIYV